MKVLTLDIETRPSVAYVWALFDQNISIDQIIQPHGTICFAAKWYGEKKVHFYSDHHDGHDVMVQKAHEMMSEADAIVHFNGRSFDVKHLHGEFVLAGMAPPAPHKDVDLLAVVRKQFRLTSNKLDFVARHLGVGSKVKHTGFDLWADCLKGDEKAWALMKKYNVGDVLLTEKVYDKLLPWIWNHPHPRLYDDTLGDVCQRCGSDHLVCQGFAFTNLGKFQRYRCRSCGGWSRGKKAVAMVDVRGI